MNEQYFSGIGMTSQRTRNRLVQRLRDSGIGDEEVLAVIARTPRHFFIDEALAHRAYEDTALPIGNGQTISQPYTVARMTEVLLANERPGREGKPAKVLEIGTGSGYQSAVLSPLVGHLYSVERIEVLHHKALQRLTALGLENITLALSDGTWGWPEHGPYDAILAAAAPEDVPQSLLDQLADGGRLVLPVGSEEQKLMLITRHGNYFSRKTLEPARFVPFLSGVQR